MQGHIQQTAAEQQGLGVLVTQDTEASARSLTATGG